MIIAEEPSDIGGQSSLFNGEDIIILSKYSDSSIKSVINAFLLFFELTLASMTAASICSLVIMF